MDPLDLLVPNHLHDGLRRYVENRIQPGDFLTAVLENDLREACLRADDISGPALHNIVAYLYNYIPMKAWGSPENVHAWLYCPDCDHMWMSHDKIDGCMHQINAEHKCGCKSTPGE